MFSAFKNFSHLGHIWPEDPAPATGSALLLEDGTSYLLLEDGVSRLLLE